MTYDVAIIGGGPGGYVAAIKAAQNGLRTILFEKENIGGVCLNKGCIPTKTFLKSAAVYNTAKEAENYGINNGDVSVDWPGIMKRKNNIIEKLARNIDLLIHENKIDYINFTAKLKDRNTIVANEKEFIAKNIIIATGSEPILPSIEGINGKIVISSDEMLDMQDLPESAVIIGGGVIGLEFAYMLNRFGKQVTIVERLNRIIANADSDISNAVAKDMQKLGIKIHTEAEVVKIGLNQVSYKKNGQMFNIETECVLVAVGRKPFGDKTMLDRLSIEHKNGVIKTDNRLKTSISGIYAIGDVNGKMMLAHTASEEGIIAVENIMGIESAMDYTMVPQCIYINPEIAWVGMTEQQAIENGNEIYIGKYPMVANGRSFIEGNRSGLIKFIVDTKYGEILGVHMYSMHATELISEIVLAMKTECSIHDIVKCIHPHPTISESVLEAAKKTIGEAIHIL